MLAAPDALVTLSRDAEAYVRDWATFGLGTLLEDVDTHALREALVERLDDPDPDVRGEALVGLAHRKDPRVLGPLRAAVVGEAVTILALDAFLRSLRRDDGSRFQHVLDEAISALTQRQS